MIRRQLRVLKPAAFLLHGYSLKRPYAFRCFSFAIFAAFAATPRTAADAALSPAFRLLMLPSPMNFHSPIYSRIFCPHAGACFSRAPFIFAISPELPAFRSPPFRRYFAADFHISLPPPPAFLHTPLPSFIAMPCHYALMLLIFSAFALITMPPLLPLFIFTRSRFRRHSRHFRHYCRLIARLMPPF